MTQLPVPLSYQTLLTTASKRLISATGTTDPLTEVLTDLQNLTSASHLSLWRNVQDPHLGWCGHCTHAVPNPLGQLRLIYQPHLHRWQESLAQGQLISGKLTDFPASEQEFWHPWSISALLVLPLQVNEQWYGCLLLAETSSPRLWTAEEQYGLALIAELLSGYLTRSHTAPEALAQAVIATMPEGVILQYANGQVGLSNPRAAYLLGLPVEQHLTSIEAHWSATHEDGSEFPVSENPAQFTLTTGHPETNVIAGLRKLDGGFIWLSINSQPLWQPGEELPYAVVCTLTDITERKYLEEILQQSEKRYRAIFNNAAVAITLVDRDGRYIQFNTTWLDLLGYSALEMRHQKNTDLCHPDDVQAIEILMQDIKTGNLDHYRIEQRLIHKNGYLLWGDLSASAIRNRHGELEAMIGIVVDITQRKHIEEERDRLFNLSVDMQSVASFDGFFKQLNIAWEHTLGWPLEQLLTKPFLALVHPDDILTTHVTFFEELLRGKSVLGFENRYRCQEGCYRWFSWNAYPLVEQKSFYAIVRDITERKQAEEALTMNERRYRAIVQDQTELICRYLPNGSLTFVNQAYCRYFGKTEAELLGHSFSPLIFDEDRGHHQQVISSLTPHSPVSEVEHRVVLPSGEVRWQHWIERAMFDESARLMEYQAVGRDITERKHAEGELLRAKEAAEMATRAKSEFLANMSHEIRTPMNGVVGMTELLLNTQLTGKQREYAEVIGQSADALQTLINDILDFSKIEAGKLILEPIAFNLENAILEVARLLSITAESKGLELRVYYSPQAPRYVIGDAGRIRQILINLVGNAIKFTQQGYVLMAITSVESQAAPPLLRFHIEDTGIGISTDKVDSVFDKFTQADSSITRQFGGTGLGLAISSQLVKMMGGHIKVESQLGKGSIFTVTLQLPLTDANLVSGELSLPSFPSPSTQWLRHLTSQSELVRAVDSTKMTGLNLKQFNLPVLLVEDNEISRMVAVNMLERFGCQVSQAKNGKEALEMSVQSPFSIVFMDVQMPEMDGFETTRLWREREGGASHTMIVAMTANAMRGDAEYCLKMGMDDYIAKPISLEQLGRVLEQSTQAKVSSPPSVILDSSPQDLTKRILLVEDNPVNRLVVINMLKKLNCSVAVAEDGQEAVTLCNQTSYDLILMDIQMPIMDGVEATHLILQSGNRNAHTPIIAVTANTRSPDVSRYLAVGMKECLAKPLTVERLRQVVEKYAKRLTTTMVTTQEAPTLGIGKGFNRSHQPASQVMTESLSLPLAEWPVFDTEQARRISLGNLRILKKVIDRFAQDTPQHLEKLSHALSTQNYNTVERLAHSIKGSARSVGALRLGEVAFRTETSVKQGNLTQIEPLAQDLRAEFQQLQQLWQETIWENLL